MLPVKREQAEWRRRQGDIQVESMRSNDCASRNRTRFVLQEIKVRFDNVPELYLKSIDQKDGEVTN